MQKFIKNISAPITNDVDDITNFTGGDGSNSFKFKHKVADQKGHDGTENVKLMVPIKNLSNSLRNLEVPLINFQINLILNWSVNWVNESHSPVKKAITFAKTNAKLYVPVVTLSFDNNEKILQQLKSGFKRTVNWSKYQSKAAIQTQNQYLDYLIDPSFPELNRLFLLSFKNSVKQTFH